MSAPEVAAGQIVGGKFTIRRERARTQHTATYEAITAPNRGVELKLLDPGARQRADLEECMKRAMTATNELPSSFALQVLDVGIDPDTGAPFLATELSMTPSLAELVQLCPLSIEEVVCFVSSLAAALEAAHSRGLAHLTVAPDNIFVGPSPRFDVRLAGFGASVLLGAPGVDARWAAPELMTNAQPACDVFSVGLVTLFALTGATLGDRSEAALRAPATTLARETGSPVDARFDAPLARALAIDPAQRYGSVPELAEAVAKALGVSIPAHVAPSRPRLVAAPVASVPLFAAAPIAPPPPFLAAPPSLAPPNAPQHGGHAAAHDPVAADAAASHREMVFAAPEAADPMLVGSPFGAGITPAAPSKNKQLAMIIGVGAAFALGAVSILVWALSSSGDGRAAPAPSASSLPAAAVSPPEEPTAEAPTPTEAPPPKPVESAAPARAPVPSSVPENVGMLTVLCTPECDVIKVDGKIVSSFPAPLPPGSHTVTVRRGLHAPQIKKVTLTRGKPETVSFIFFATHAPPKKLCGKFLQRCD